MRVGCISYPMFLEHQGGLEVQIEETVAHLRMAGVDARRIDPTVESLADFDLLHVFSAENHKIIRRAKSDCMRVVVSSVLQSHWSEWDNLIASLSTELTAKLTRWEVTTSYQQIKATLSAADHIIALGKSEKQTLIRRYGQATRKISIIPNGVAQRFFDASPDPFLAKHSIGAPFVLCAGDISNYKNQLSIVQATAAMSVPIVLLGTCVERQKAYLQRCITEGQGRVHYLGRLEHNDPLLASAFAAASVLVLPSKGEVMPLSVLEALAAGTPVVVTRNHSLDIDPHPPAFSEVNHTDIKSIAAKINDARKAPVDPASCKRLVQSNRWETIVQSIIEIYRKSIDTSR